ncbi:MAG: DedA family protein [Cardiobacteriaceae bacterium]|nr:DedA family protein [Cardiobacteriaceae bacterium]
MRGFFPPVAFIMDFGFLQTFFFEYGYYAVFGVLLLCGMGLPLPEDITLVTAGIISALGPQNVHWMFVISYLGVLVGDSLMYAIGWRFGPHIRQKRWFAKLLTPERMSRIDYLFQRYGNRLIFIARFLPGLRAPIYVITGITRRVSYWQFAAMDGLAAILSVPLFVYVGYYGAENHEWLVEKMREFKYLTIAIILVVIAVVIYYLWKRKRRLAFFRSTRARLKEMRKRNPSA